MWLQALGSVHKVQGLSMRSQPLVVFSVVAYRQQLLPLTSWFLSHLTSLKLELSILLVCPSSRPCVVCAQERGGRDSWTDIFMGTRSKGFDE